MVGAALSVGVFYGCQKDLQISDPVSSNNSKSVANPLTVEMVQSWFQSEFGKSKTIAPTSSGNSLVSSVNGNGDSYFFNQTFDIKPFWAESKIATFLQTNPIVIVPVVPIAFLDDKGMNYTLVFFRDSLQKIDAKLQVYKPTQSYLNTHTTVNVQDFSGLFYQIGLNGLVQKVFTIENGKFTKQVFLARNSGFGSSVKLNTRMGCDCFHRGSGESIFQEIGCLIACLFHGGGSSSGDEDTYVPPIPAGWSGQLQLGSNDNSNNYIPTNTGGSGSTPNLNSEIDNTLFDVADQTVKFSFHQNIYRQKGFNDTEFENLYFHPKLFTQVNKFFDDKSSSPENINAIKQLINNFSLDVEDRTRQVRLLNNDDAYFNANQAAGMPDVGSSAWKNTLAFNLSPPTNGLDPARVTFPKAVNSKEALFAREFAKSASSYIDNLFTQSVVHVDQMTTQKLDAFELNVKTIGGQSLGIIGNRKAAILSFNVAAFDITNPAAQITIFDNQTNNGTGFTVPGLGEIGAFEVPVAKVENFTASSFRSVNSIQIDGISGANNKTRTISIGLSIVSLNAD